MKLSLIQNIRTGLRQAVWLIIASVLCGFLFNFFNKDKLPLVAEPSVSSRTDPRAIDIFKAREIFNEGNAIFIDARTQADYERGHIPGALNIYAMDFKSQAEEILKDIPYETMFIVYCDGEGCELSQSLAKDMELSGYQNIRILYAGWKSWKNENK